MKKLLRNWLPCPGAPPHRYATCLYTYANGAKTCWMLPGIRSTIGDGFWTQYSSIVPCGMTLPPYFLWWGKMVCYRAIRSAVCCMTGWLGIHLMWALYNC